jgi:hypothetical protein
MTYPVTNRSLLFENDTFSIQFEIDNLGVHFTLLNKMYDGIKVNWDEVSFSINGQAQRIVHKETGVYKISDVQPPTTIPPKSSLSDYLVPTSNIRYLNYANRSFVFVGSLLPVIVTGKYKIEDAVRKYKGTKITIFLPLYIGNKYVSYFYDIIIDDVTPTNTPSNILQKITSPETSTKRNRGDIRNLYDN